MTTIDQALADIMKLDFNTREMLLEILQKRQVEARRDAIAKNAKKSLKEYHTGSYVALSVDEAIGHLNSL